jgi:DNA-binding transcriptional ArsR family regulator
MDGAKGVHSFAATITVQNGRLVGQVSAATVVPVVGRKRADWLDGVADPVRLHILRSLSQVAEATAANLTYCSQASHQTLRRHLEALVTLGVIEERQGESDGETPGRPATRFRLPPEVRRSVRAVLGASG